MLPLDTFGMVAVKRLWSLKRGRNVAEFVGWHPSEMLEKGSLFACPLPRHRSNTFQPCQKRQVTDLAMHLSHAGLDQLKCSDGMKYQRYGEHFS
ncbi:hypothetical protein M514_00394, partial [Trichuris suis]